MIARGGFLEQAAGQIPGGAVVFRYRRLLIGCALATPLVVALAHLASSAIFVSEARVLVKLGREFLSPITSGGRTTSMYRLDEAINSEIEILTSHELAHDVVETVGMDVLFPDIREGAASPEIAAQESAVAFLEKLGVSGVLESSVIRVSFAHEEPALAKESLSLLLERFQERHLQVFADAPYEMAERRVSAARASLAAAELKQSAYRDEHHVYDLGEERSLLLRRREDIETRLRSARDRIAAIESGGAPGSLEAAEESSAERSLLALRAEERRLLNHYHENSRVVETVRAQVAVLEGLTEDRLTSESDVLEQEVVRLGEAVADIAGALQSMQGHERVLRVIERSVANAEARLADALEAQDVASSEATLDSEHVTSIIVIDRPTLPLDAIGIGLIAKIVMGFIAGLLLGGSIVILLYLLENTNAPRAHAGSVESRDLMDLRSGERESGLSGEAVRELGR